MFALALDTAVRPPLEPSIVAAPHEANMTGPSESFETHLSREEAAGLSARSRAPETSRDEQRDDESALDTNTSAEAGTPIQTPPNTNQPQETAQHAKHQNERNEDECQEDDQSGPQSLAKSARAKRNAVNEELAGSAASEDSGKELLAAETSPAATSTAGTESSVAATEVAASNLSNETRLAFTSFTNESTSDVAAGQNLAEAQSVTAPTVDLEAELPAGESREPTTDEIATANSLSEPAKSELRRSKVNRAESANAIVNKPPDLLAAAIAAVPTREQVNSGENESQPMERVAPPTIEGPIAAANNPVSENSPTTATNRLAQHLALASDELTGKGNSLSGVDQNRFLDRVARAFRVAENRQGVVKLRLHPPELGALRIELRMHNGALHARLEAETAVTQSLLLEHAYALRDRLSEQGVRVAGFEVDLADRRSMEHPGSFDERSNQDRSPSHQERRDEQPLASHDPHSTRGRPSLPAPGQLNVII